MTISKDSNGLFQTSHLTLLISYTLFSVALIVESFLMGWEKWMLLLVVAGVIVSWVLHIKHDTPAGIRLWIYAVLMMGEFFFYGTHQTSTFDLAVVMSALIMLFTMTGIKSLITLCQFTYYGTMAFEIVSMVLAHEEFDALGYFGSD